ncbi:hypothetical protein BDV97DRAFT_355535 [Delphinella strobiligena]|nr:hypothetical protein BDV97DRAFT_355535 [Delphinella strobiligena]
MTRRPRGPPPQMSSSWASNMEDTWDESVDLKDSEGESGFEPPQARLSASGVNRLREAIDGDDEGSYPSLETARQEHLPGSRSVPRASVRRAGVASAVYEESPRKRNTKMAQSTGSDFIMPFVDNGPNYDRQEYTTMSTRLPGSSTRPTQVRNSQRAPRGTRQRPSRSYIQDEEPHAFWSNVLSSFFQFALSVLGIALSFLKPVLGYALALWLLVGGFIFARNLLFTSINTALTPLCHIPGSSLLNLPFCNNDIQSSGPKPQAEFNKLVDVTSKFEDILIDSVNEGHIPADLKRSESSIRDLGSIIPYSGLPSKNELGQELHNFAALAKQASNDLTKYNSRTSLGMDKIITTNKWTLQVLEGIKDDEANRGAIPRFIESINIFAPFLPDVRMSEDLIVDQYMRHTSDIQAEVTLLITQAESLLRVLDELENRLDVIYAITIRDGIKVEGTRDELLSQLWTRLGGNKSSVARMEAQLKMLGNVLAYRRTASAHVSGTITKLQAISANLEDLKVRVTLPENLGAKGMMPLAYHIEQIQMGVDRLEDIRDEKRGVENRRLRAILDTPEPSLPALGAR